MPQVSFQNGVGINRGVNLEIKTIADEGSGEKAEQGKRQVTSHIYYPFSSPLSPSCLSLLLCELSFAISGFLIPNLYNPRTKIELDQETDDPYVTENV